MKNVVIRRPIIEDIEEMNIFFSTVIIDTFAREGLSYMVEDIEQEIEVKKEYFKNDLESNGVNRYFLIALVNDEIIGSIEYGLANDIINNITDKTLPELVEIGTVFVRPDYQRQRVGNLLLSEMYKALKNRGIEGFCLDSGYKNAQKIWKKKFGDPYYLLKDYWAKGNDHMIWRIKLNDIII